MPLPRIRQVVVAARDLAATRQRIEDALGVTKPFHDEGVATFGLANAVYALGDTFVEIVSPTGPDTAAGRQIDRHGGDCGYMIMVEVGDEAALRRRLADEGVRVIWQSSHPDIVDLHLHPKDVPGAIVAVDVCTPPGSWRWGGPAWTGAVPARGAGGVTGVTVAVADPRSAAGRWAAVLGMAEPDEPILVLDGGRQHVRFVAAAGPDGIIGVTADVPDRRGTVTVAGVDIDRTAVEG